LNREATASTGVDVSALTFTSISPYVCMTWCLIKDKHDFTLLYSAWLWTLTEGLITLPQAPEVTFRYEFGFIGVTFL
jgi:hypothetical protein